MTYRVDRRSEYRCNPELGVLSEKRMRWLLDTLRRPRGSAGPAARPQRQAPAGADVRPSAAPSLDLAADCADS